MSRSGFIRSRCPICRARGATKWISSAGLARTSHMRAHEAKGEAIEKAPGVWVDPLEIPTENLPYRYIKRFRPELLEP